ncbi:unnamed protein product [Coregonus sp. 'balchen']|nr:unnamed protein product [Coregonus sp. 'balchen']
MQQPEANVRQKEEEERVREMEEPLQHIETKSQSTRSRSSKRQADPQRRVLQPSKKRAKEDSAPVNDASNQKANFRRQKEEEYEERVRDESLLSTLRPSPSTNQGHQNSQAILNGESAAINSSRAKRTPTQRVLKSPMMLKRIFCDEHKA